MSAIGVRACAGLHRPPLRSIAERAFPERDPGRLRVRSPAPARDASTRMTTVPELASSVSEASFPAMTIKKGIAVQVTRLPGCERCRLTIGVSGPQNHAPRRGHQCTRDLAPAQACPARVRLQYPRTFLRMTRRVCRMVVLATQWPATRVRPGPHPKRTRVVIPSAC